MSNESVLAQLGHRIEQMDRSLWWGKVAQFSWWATFALSMVGFALFFGTDPVTTAFWVFYGFVGAAILASIGFSVVAFVLWPDSEE